MNRNTTILKWDVTVQKIFIAFNVIALCSALINPMGAFVYLLMLQLIEGLYQLTGSAVHLRLQHKSIGYRRLRKIHFWGSLVYLLAFYLLQGTVVFQTLWLLIMFLIPQFIFYAYFALCYYELKYLEHREFHILR